MKGFAVSFCAAGAMAAFAAGTPRVADVQLSFDATAHLATIGYTLADAPGVVTFDIQTNVTGDAWASIGGEALAGAWGDVNAYVEGVGESHTIFWKPHAGLEIDETAFRAVVTAWPEEAPPDYMVIDLNMSTNPAASLLQGHSFYPDADQIPGGIQSRVYKTDKLVMRKIPVCPTLKWVMGADGAANSTAHYVTLTNNFYMGVYEMTIRQWEIICTNLPSSTITKTFYTNFTDAAVLPVSGIDYNETRGAANGKAWGGTNTAADVQRAVDQLSVSQRTPIGMLRKRTGILFDVPTEAQWEYACRAGTATAYNNGTGASAENCAALAWCSGNSTRTSIYGQNILAVHPVGTKALPNAWGLYDMHGNVREMCQDIWTNKLEAVDAIEPRGPEPPSSGSIYRVYRGGSYSDAYDKCCSGYRTYTNANAHYPYNGLRVVCPYPLNLKW